MRGVFVTGTDTGVGKTIVSACLVSRWGAEYWKPAQTGVPGDAADTDTVTALSGAFAHPPRYVFRAPLSVEAASRLENVAVRSGDFALPAADAPLVVEGAGGVLVPLSADETMADLMRALGLPVVLAARTALGTINHTLLSLEALRARRIAVAGVVFSGPPDAANAEAIARHGRVRILGTIPLLSPLTPETLAAAAATLPAFAESVAA